MKRDLVLEDGSRVAIIGGGPAGSFFAHFIQKYAQQRGITLSVTIFDGKDFLQPGPKGCNLCAGVLSSSLHQRLNQEGIFLPEKRIINRVDGYDLHVDGEHLLLTCAENKKEKIATVFRGNGPRYSTFPDIVSFDDFLLSWAQDKETKVISQPVWDIRLPKNRGEPVRLVIGRKEKLRTFDADLVVGAFGVNSYLLKKIQSLDFGYRPPSTLTTYQAELRLGREKVINNFGNTIHVYMPKSKNIRYATVIPKGDYISLTLVSKKNATKEILSEFLRLEEIHNKIPSSAPPCFCYPKIVASPSKRPFSDRLVIIGDASFSRHYKNGIESAFTTAMLAAETAVNVGIDASSFSSHYFKRAKKLIIDDNAYGRLLFMLNDIISSIPLLIQSHISLAREKRNSASAKKIRFILWNMFTGNIPYKDIFKTLLDIKLQATLLLNALRLIFPDSKKYHGKDIQRHH
jgi:flavin-dependent dehydrogenase